MSNGEQSSSRGHDDWRILLSTMVGAAVVSGLVLLVLNLVNLNAFPLGLILFVAGFMIGIVLGRRAGSRLFRKPPGR
jgi:hypothetical protein